MFTKYIVRRVEKLKMLFALKRFERVINKGWKKNLQLADDVRIEHGLKLLEAEEKLTTLKRIYALM